MQPGAEFEPRLRGSHLKFQAYQISVIDVFRFSHRFQTPLRVGIHLGKQLNKRAAQKCRVEACAGQIVGPVVIHLKLGSHIGAVAL